MKKLLLLLVTLIVTLGLNAAEYGTLRSVCPVRYSVTSGEVAVRFSPNMKAKKVRTINGGDIVYVDNEERITSDNIQWVKVSGEDAYIPVRMLTVENNPYYVHTAPKVMKTKGLVKFGFYDLPRWLAWTLLSVWLGLAFLLCLAVSLVLPPFGGVGERPNLEKFVKNPEDKDQVSAIYGNYGMRKILFFNKQPYITFLHIAACFVISFIVTLLLFLLIGSLVWGSCWIGRILLVSLYWILVVVGYGGGGIAALGAVFAGDGCGEKIIFGVVGGLLIWMGVAVGNAQDAIYGAGLSMVEWGNRVFEVFNIFSLSIYIVKTYWFTALLIALAPLALFLVCAVLFLTFAGILILCENAVMKKYNVEHPCPMCGRPSEPAVYLSHGKPLPVKLHPGMWGLFNITHPATGEKMPTLFLRGKDRLERQCASCDDIISANVGVEKHVAFAGVAKSGKSTLLYRVVAEMLRTKVGSESVCAFTDDLGDDEITAKRFLKTIENGQQMKEFPVKTTDERHKSLQLIVSNPKGLLPYRLYVNDVAGEVFRSKNSQNLETASFLKNTDVLVFVLDPFTVKSDELEYSERMKAWCEQNIPAGAKKQSQIDVKEALDTLSNMLLHLQGRKDSSNIDMMFTFVKTDTGYLSGVDVNDQEALKQFAIVDMGLGQVIHDLSHIFKNVTFHAVSAADSVDKSGVGAFVDGIFDRLDISFKKVTPQALSENKSKALVEKTRRLAEDQRYSTYHQKKPYSEYGLTIGVALAFALAIFGVWIGGDISKSIQEKNYKAVVAKVDALMKDPKAADAAIDLISKAMVEQNLSTEHLRSLNIRQSEVKTERMRYIDSMMSVLYSNIESVGGKLSNVEISARYGALDNLKDIKSKLDELLTIIPDDAELLGYKEKFEKVLNKYKIAL